MRRAPAAALAGLALAVAGCGGSGSHATTSHHPPDLTVAAAASLKAPFTAYAHRFARARARYSFAGSDQLAAQIEHGVRPDVYAAANTTLPELLFANGLVSKPVAFTANSLVVAVRAHGSRVRTLRDLEKPDVTIAAGSRTVPIGIYTRQVLARLSPRERAGILANIRSEEPDVAGIVGKLLQGAVDAGFTYVTDVRAAGGALKAIALPDSLQPVVTYGAAVVKGSAHTAEAAAFISGLRRGAGRRDLLMAGFLPPPGR